MLPVSFFQVDFKQVTEMTSVLLQALFHIGNASPDEVENVIGVLEGFLRALAANLTSMDESVLGEFLRSKRPARTHQIRVIRSHGIDNLDSLS